MPLEHLEYPCKKSETDKERYEKAKRYPVNYKFCSDRWIYGNKFLLSFFTCIRLTFLQNFILKYVIYVNVLSNSLFAKISSVYLLGDTNKKF